MKKKIFMLKRTIISFRQISKSFYFGNHKIGRVWKQYKQTTIIQEPSKRGPRPKLAPDVLMNIDDTISQNARSTLNPISQKVSVTFNISISKSTIETGLSKLRYHYKTPKL